MRIFYSPNYNIDFGLLNRLHPFDGTKYTTVIATIQNLPGIEIVSPSAPITQDIIDEFVDWLIKSWIRKKRYILQALGLPYIPLLPFSLIDKRILLPMRWAVAGTLAAAEYALAGHNCWNLSGGYHHASRGGCEGFCIYNDIGIAVQQLRKTDQLHAEARILIIDVDAHHGNGNAQVFMDDNKVTLLDIYNRDIYPQGAERELTKRRVNFALPISSGTDGPAYLRRLHEGLALLQSGYAIAFVVAGTDVLAGDPLGGLNLSIDDCVQRDAMILTRLQALGVPAVFLGGGGYAANSAIQIAASLTRLHAQ